MNNLIIEILARLNKELSKRKIQSDIKELEKTPFYIKLIGRLDKSLTRNQLQRDIQDIQNTADSMPIEINAEINTDELQRSYNEARADIEREVQDNPININVNANVGNINTGEIVRERQQAERNTILRDYINSHEIFQRVSQAIKNAIVEVEKLNKAETDLQMVTQKTDREMKYLMQDYNSLAKEIGATTLEVTDGASEWLRQGKSISDTNTLIRDSMILSKVSQMESSEATKYLTSAMNGYKTEVTDVIGIVDKLNAVDMASASDAAGLAESLSRCSNSANVAGISMDRLIAYIATVSEVTQKSASSVGEGFKSITARLQNIKVNNFIDEDGIDISGEINDAEKILGKFGIALRNNAKEFRDAQDVIDDVAKSWSNMSSVEQSAIATAFGTVHQRENVVALFENYNRALELTEISANSAGTAMEKFAIYEESLESATNRLTASLQSMAYNAIDSDFLINITNSTAKIVEFIDKTQLLKTSLTAGIFTGVLSGLVALGTRIMAVTRNISSFTQAMNLSRQSTAISTGQYAALTVNVRGLTEAQLRLVLSSRQLNDQQRLELMQSAGIEGARRRQILQALNLTNATNAQTSATFSLRGAWEALRVSIESNPIGFAVTLITGALTAATMFYQTHKQNQEEARQAAVDSANAYKEQANGIEELRQKYIDIIDSEGTAAEKTEKLNEWKQNLIETYNFEKEALEKVNLEREKSLDLLDKEIKKQNRENRGEWLGENRKLINNALNRINTTNYDSKTDGIISSELFNKIDANEVRESVKDLFKDIYELGAEGNWQFAIDEDNLIERYENIQKVISKLGNSKNLSDSERNLLDSLNKESAAMKKVLDENLEIYQTYYDYKAENNLEDYVVSKPIEDVGKDTYLAWKKGLIDTAGGDIQLEKELDKIAERQFPEYEKYFDNLANAYDMFGVDDIVNDANEGTKKLFINSLSDEDLAILIQLDKDIFDRGIDGVEKAIADFKADPANVVEAEINTINLEELQTRYEEIGKSVDTFVKNQKTVKSAFEELEKHGQLSADTIKSLIDSGYASALMYDETTGAVTLNTAELESLNAQKRNELKLDFLKQKTELAEKYKEEEKSISDLRAEYEALGKVSGAANQARLNEITLELAKHGATANEILDMINQYEGLISSLDAPTFDTDNKSNKDKPQFVLDYEEWVAKAEHEIAMGLKAEDKAYYDEKISRARTAYDNLEDYQSDLWKAEEEYYKWCNDQDEELFEKRIDNYEKLTDKVLDGKLSLEDFRKEMEKFNNEMQKTYGLGNVDLTKRPMVNMPDGSTATVLSSTEFLWQGDEENGKYVAVHYTPILPDGTILDDDTLSEYLYDTLESSENILDADKNGLGIVLKVDTDLNISDDDIRSLETDKPTENIQNIIDACDEWDVSLHEIQEDWVEMSKLFDDNGNFIISASFDFARSEVNAAIEETQNRINELSLKPGFEDEVESLIKDLEDLNDCRFVNDIEHES